MHIDTVTTSFKAVDSVGQCYLSAKLRALDGPDIPDEKVRGKPSGSPGVPPELSAELGHKYRLAEGRMPVVVVQLKRKTMTSNVTVRRGGKHPRMARHPRSFALLRRRPSRFPRRAETTSPPALMSLGAGGVCRVRPGQCAGRARRPAGGRTKPPGRR